MLAIFCFFALTQAHLCLINPPQRGPVPPLNTPATPECSVVEISKVPHQYTTFCGQLAPKNPIITYTPGSIVPMAWQKNNNHFNTTNPASSFSVFLLSSTDAMSAKRHALFSIPDNNDPQLTVIIQLVQIPAALGEFNHAVLQVVYDAPYDGKDYVYYQCVDIAVRYPAPNRAGVVVGVLFGFILVALIAVAATRYWMMRGGAYQGLSTQ